MYAGIDGAALGFTADQESENDVKCAPRDAVSSISLFTNDLGGFLVGRGGRCLGPSL